MEELRSTEILDKEIRADSRKKIEEIIAKADETVKALAEGVADRVKEAEEKAKSASDERVSIYKKNIEASLPLEKQRHLVSFIHSSVMEAVNNYFDGLTPKKRLDIIKSLAERAKPLCKGKKMTAEVYGMTVDSAEKMLSSVLGTAFDSAVEGKASDLEAESVPLFTRREGIVLKAKDKSLICRLTLDQKVKEIIELHNLELSQALFGGRLPE